MFTHREVLLVKVCPGPADVLQLHLDVRQLQLCILLGLHGGAPGKLSVFQLINRTSAP